MKTVFAAIAGAALFATAAIAEKHPFLAWADSVVVNTSFTRGVETGTRTVTVEVTEKWSDPTVDPRNKYSLSAYIVCTKYLDFVMAGAAAKTKDNTFENSFYVQYIKAGVHEFNASIVVSEERCKEVTDWVATHSQ